MGRSFLLTGKSFLLAVGLTVNWLGLFDLRFSLFLLMVEIRFGLFYLRFPPLRKLGFVFFPYVSPTVSKKDEP